jgi:hypothetical protein
VWAFCNAPRPVDNEGNLRWNSIAGGLAAQHTTSLVRAGSGVVQVEGTRCVSAQNHGEERFLSLPNGTTKFVERIFRVAASLLLLTIAIGVIAGCAAVDTLEPRGDTLNRTLTDYRNTSTLLNIVRAGRNEPMNFIAMTGTTGHGTLTANEGLPTFVVGPGILAAPVSKRNYTFGPNTVSESASNDFTVSVLDDPASYAALMTPLEIATIAFFLQEQLPRPLLLPLFINQIRIIPDGANTIYEFNPNKPIPEFIYCELDPEHGNKLKCEVPVYYLEGDPAHSSEAIAAKMAACRAATGYCLNPVMFVYGYLYYRGLIFQTPTGAVPSQAGLPYRICFDPLYSVNRPQTFEQFLGDSFIFTDGTKDLTLRRQGFFDTFADARAVFPKVPSVTKVNKSDLCDDSLPWTQPGDASKAASPAQQSAGGSGTPSSLCLNGACAASNTQKAASTTKGTPLPWAFEFYDPYNHATIQITTRSTRGLYLYLGNLVRQQGMGLPTTLFQTGLSADPELFKVVINGLAGCFTSVTYGGMHYCIPTEASNAKTILSLLHELVNLYTRPNSSPQPNTGTVRITQ